MRRHLILIVGLLLAGCASYKHPSTSSDPAKMSADTLCFRYASSKDEALADEINARGIDCMDMLKDDPLYNNRDLDPAYRMGR